MAVEDKPFYLFINRIKLNTTREWGNFTYSKIMAAEDTIPITYEHNIELLGATCRCWRTHMLFFQEQKFHVLYNSEPRSSFVCLANKSLTNYSKKSCII